MEEEIEYGNNLAILKKYDEACNDTILPALVFFRKLLAGTSFIQFP